MHLGMLARMFSIVFPCVDMMRVCWCGMSPVVGYEPGGGDKLVTTVK